MRALTIVLVLCLWATFDGQSQTPSPTLTEKEKNEVNGFLQGIYGIVVATQKMLLSRVDYEPLATDARGFAAKNGWGQSASGPGGLRFAGDNPALPASIRTLKPSSVHVFQDRIVIECGGTFHHQGISVFRNTDGGNGTRQLGKGIWYYSEHDKIFEGPPPKI